MDYSLQAVAIVFVTASAIAILHLVKRSRSGAKKCSCPANLPPGSLGLPLIGQTVGLIRALRANRDGRWIQDRMDRYGPVSKLSLFGTPTALLTGPAANKFMFFSRQLRKKQVKLIARITGEKNMANLHGEDHRRLRAALLEFLKPDMLKLYVGRIEAEVRRHLEEKWHGRSTVRVDPLMKRLTCDIMTGLLFGLEKGAVQDALADDLRIILVGVVSIPVNLPFMTYGRSVKASQRVRRLLEEMTRDKKAKLGLGLGKGNTDLITRLLSLTDDHGEQLVTMEEIVDNSLGTLIAGHDTTSILITFMVRQLANDPATLAAMVEEHEDIARNKSEGEDLNWEDLSKMKFTWLVAQETLRIVPPLFGDIRTALEDIDFDGYCIPKGWQVLWTANVTHMDASIFHEPAKFDPSRFDNQSSTTRTPCSFVAFGAGPRICPGIEFTRIQTLVTMHHLVRCFRWKLCLKENTFVRDPFPSPLHGLPVELEHKTFH